MAMVAQNITGLTDSTNVSNIRKNCADHHQPVIGTIARILMKKKKEQRHRLMVAVPLSSIQGGPTR